MRGSIPGTVHVHVLADNSCSYMRVPSCEGRFFPLRWRVSTAFGSLSPQSTMRAFVLAVALVAGATGFRVSAPSHMVRRAAATRPQVAVMAVQEDEKKGLFSFFQKSDDVQGKVVSTKKGGKEPEEELSESKKMMQKVKDAGVSARRPILC